jgi:hypothetical protein
MAVFLPQSRNVSYPWNNADGGVSVAVAAEGFWLVGMGALVGMGEWVLSLSGAGCV